MELEEHHSSKFLFFRQIPFDRWKKNPANKYVKVIYLERDGMQGLVNLSKCAVLGNILNQLNGVITELVADSDYTKEDAANELMQVARSIHEEIMIRQF